MSAGLSPYRGQPVAFLTRHGKQTLVTEPLQRALGCRIVHTEAFDTDLLGTFTRDVDRQGSQREAARRKARVGMDLLGTPVGLASEGSFGPDPGTGAWPWNVEMLLWLDLPRSLEVVGVAQGPACHHHAALRSLPQLLAFAQRSGFPSHRLTLRPAHADHPEVVKGLGDEASLHQAFAQCLARAANGVVWAESDLRAFCNPTRQQLIASAAQDLARRLASRCPACGMPGYGIERAIPGLPCRDCDLPSTQPRAHRWACPACGHAHEQPVAFASANPSRCDSCNP